MDVATITPCTTKPILTATIPAKSGAKSARVWTVRVKNTGTVAASNAKLFLLNLTQTLGPACTPVIRTPLPAALGTIASGGTADANVTVDFSSCAAQARFTAILGLAADSGYAVGSLLLSQPI